jgi:hypothetical protein
MVVGLVALAALVGFRVFAASVQTKVAAHAACVRTLDGECSRAAPGAPNPQQPLRSATAPMAAGFSSPVAHIGLGDTVEHRIAPIAAAFSSQVGAPAPPPPTPKPQPADKQVNDPTLRTIDAKLSAVFTDTGFVRAASSVRNVSVAADRSPTDSHYALKDGKLHTMHIFANEAADSDAANVYIPKAFSDVMITSKDTVVAKNPKTGEVIMIAHVQVGSGAQGLRTLRENMKTTRPNGTVLIGRIGGEGGGNGDYVHSHLSFFPSEAARLRATAFKKKNWDYTSETSENLADFRKLVK